MRSAARCSRGRAAWRRSADAPSGGDRWHGVRYLDRPRSTNDVILRSAEGASRRMATGTAEQVAILRDASRSLSSGRPKAGPVDDAPQDDVNGGGATVGGSTVVGQMVGGSKMVDGLRIAPLLSGIPLASLLSRHGAAKPARERKAAVPAPGIRCSRDVHSLFGAAGKAPYRFAVTGKIRPRRRREGRKSDFPCYFPCSQGKPRAVASLLRGKSQGIVCG